MESSLLLAKLLGLCRVIVAAGMRLDRWYQSPGAIKDFALSKGAIIFSGSIAFFLGLPLTLALVFEGHSWQGSIFLLEYLILFSGGLKITQKAPIALLEQRYGRQYFDPAPFKGLFNVDGIPTTGHVI